jgi:tRNA pseudouridine55 synthase
MGKDAEIHGVLVVDKPMGPTSHDVVAWARRALGTRAVGHAGTLDPMATGVLVLAIGEGTKLVPYLTLDEKEYELELVLGSETDTLDAQGEVVETAPVPALDEARVRSVLDGFLGPQEQRPPAYSAIKVDGVALHKRARRGEDVQAPLRQVTVHALALRSLAPLALTVRASKGYYVRSFGRDFARALGSVGHLAALRRIASGPFRIDDAVSGELLLAARQDPARRPEVIARVLPLIEAVRTFRCVSLDAQNEAHARAGRLVRPVPAGLEEADVVAMIGTRGDLVAIGERRGDGLAVRRGFRSLSVDEDGTADQSG